ncbi:Receptor-type guanylate cyclase gcy [Seminavis robusta]|uniref:Receptor-type guanylate cyclase gcy n=1 Tax=Seminavis robusta TaxID=568900 RepID=A0A9N8HJ62_9STRA|nr:Receptor-type guanylate cyclase gcy [Seminavis robusta]|eukprot:Sro537_g162260.1 Receptor-type guanylate cyclase gcy (755) ;mRNA; f:4181-6956
MDDPHYQDHSVADWDSTTHHSHQLQNTDQQLQKGEEKIGAKEDKAVFGIRLVVVLVLLLSTLAMALIVYFYTRNAEEQEFDQQFQDDSTKVFESIGSNIDLTLGAVDNFALGLVSYARLSNSTYPFVTLPDFAVRTAKLRAITKAMEIGTHPVVTAKNRLEWEEYSGKHAAEWIDESIRVQSQDPTYHGYPVANWTGLPVIHTLNGPMEYNTNTELHIPKWTTSPIVPQPWSQYNYDVYNDINLHGACNAVLEKRTVVIAKSLNLPDLNNPVEVAIAEATAAWTKAFIGDTEDPTEPLSGYYYPVLEGASDNVVLNHKQENVLGIVIVAVWWRDLIRDILPSGSDGVIVVFQNCEQTFTYRVDGPKTTFLGRGDLHEPKYDSYGQWSSFKDLHTFSEGSTRSYSGAPFDEDFCPYSVGVYPSSDMEDNHITNNPVIYSVVAISIFLFTSVVFLCYDKLVERRQRIVMQRALASGAIVSSLFPEKVKQQLYQEQEQEKQKQQNANNFTVQPERDMALNGDIKKTKPIADLFEETTIFFADLAGFTAWSSKRTPVEVFELLEALYGAFDEIARRRCVFKVETIGDCYVAVTGIPEPQKNHAVIMARFARDCMKEMKQLVRGELSDVLGEDTKDLEMRVGLHSGSATAGVLRGDKGRFQLFGDTVNTASRMESNGVKGRIHVSQSTADSLRARGKEHWLEERQDRIVAKGKGVMQTYFVNVTESSAKSIRSGAVSVQSNCSYRDEDEDEPVSEGFSV